MSTSHLIMSNPWTSDNNAKTLDKSFMVDKESQNPNDRLTDVAKRELREDDNSRRQCLQHLREWIRKNEDIENCITNDRFLLRFLRVKKFSIPMTEQTLLKYLNFRKRFSHFMTNMDCLDENVFTLTSNGYIFASPFRDDNGCRVIIYDCSKFDPRKYSGVDMARAHAVTYETILDDEENQLLGINHVGDLAGLNPAFLGLWSISEFATIIRWGEQSFPMRHKQINILNMPSGLRYVYEFAQSNVRSQKLRDRIAIHANLTELSRKVNKNCLPQELGGIMPAADMIQLWQNELAAKRDLLLSYDSMKLLSDRGIIRRRTAQVRDETGLKGLAGSFRKLEVD